MNTNPISLQPAYKWVRAIAVSSSIATVALSASLSAASTYIYVVQDFTQAQLRNTWENDTPGTIEGLTPANGGHPGLYLRYNATTESDPGGASSPGGSAHLSGQNFGFDAIDFENIPVNSAVASITWITRKTSNTMWLGLGSSADKGIGFIVSTGGANSAVYTSGINTDLGGSGDDYLIKSYGDTKDFKTTYTLGLVKVSNDEIGLSLTYDSDNSADPLALSGLIIDYNDIDAPRALWDDVLGYDSIYQKVSAQYSGLYNVEIAMIPEPSSFALGGFVLLLSLIRRQRS